MDASSLTLAEQSVQGGLGLIEETLDFLDESTYVLEPSINRGEPDIGDRIELTKLFHDRRSDLMSRDLALLFDVEALFDELDDVFLLLGWNRPLLAGLHQAAEELAAAEIFAPAVRLDHQIRNGFDLLVGGESAAAIQAFPDGAGSSRFSAIVLTE